MKKPRQEGAKIGVFGLKPDQDFRGIAIRSMNRLRLLPLLLLAACGKDGGSSLQKLPPAPIYPPPLSKKYPIDGAVDFSKLSDVKSLPLLFKDPSGALVRSTTITFATENDDRDLYLAVQWGDPTHANEMQGNAEPKRNDWIRILSDNNGNGTLENKEGQHALIAAYQGVANTSSYADMHADFSAAWPHAAVDRTGDGLGRMKHYSSPGAEGYYQAEFLLPLASDVNGEDAVIDGVATGNILIWDDFETATGKRATALLSPGEGPDTSLWGKIPYKKSGATDRPVLPADLEGLIVFISTHEDARGEIYSFDPKSKALLRITNDDLYKDAVSLSHDRKKVAYMAGPNPDAYETWEVYTAEVNAGANLPKRLTNNAVLDGHPAWSPDDSKLIYSSMVEYPANADQHVRIMNLNGTLLSDLTLILGDLTFDGREANETDPEWLPNGEVLFITNRFGPNEPSHTMRLARVKPDGTGLKQLTFTKGVADHDPVGNGTHAVYERVHSDKPYWLPGGFFVPVKLIEVPLDGSGTERLLLPNNDFVQWLPVYGPGSSGKYLIYLHTFGHTELGLIGADGTNYGRLVPNITDLSYVDWK